MTRPTPFCRVAWIVDDMDATVAQFRDLFGLSMRFGPIAPDIIKAGIDEHGFEPIQLYVPAADLPFMNGLPYPLVEVALAVDDCEEPIGCWPPTESCPRSPARCPGRTRRNTSLRMDSAEFR